MHWLGWSWIIFCVESVVNTFVSVKRDSKNMTNCKWLVWNFTTVIPIKKKSNLIKYPLSEPHFQVLIFQFSCSVSAFSALSPGRDIIIQTLMECFRQVAQNLYLLWFQWQLKFWELLNTGHVSPSACIDFVQNMGFFTWCDLFPWQFLSRVHWHPKDKWGQRTIWAEVLVIFWQVLVTFWGISSTLESCSLVQSNMN